MITLERHFDAELRALTEPLPRIAFRSKDQIEARLREGQPAIFMGALEDWPARKNWNPDYFRSRWGDRPARAHETKWEGRAPYLSTISEHSARKTLSEYFDGAHSEAGYSVYLYEAEAASTFPGSEQDLDYLSLIDPDPAAPALNPRVWMGTPGTRSGLHFDPADNLIAMFHGSKAILLVSPESPRCLYPMRTRPTKSPVDPAKMDWKRYPRLREARMYLDVIHPGEVLCLPKGWWHYLAALELSINATCWLRWRGHPALNTVLVPLFDLPYLWRCGPSYPLHLLFQFFWYGALGRPFYQHAMSPPPAGAMLWQHYRRRFSRGHPRG